MINRGRLFFLFLTVSDFTTLTIEMDSETSSLDDDRNSGVVEPRYFVQYWHENCQLPAPENLLETFYPGSQWQARSETKRIFFDTLTAFLLDVDYVEDGIG